MQQLYTVQDMEEAIRGKLRLNYGISEKKMSTRNICSKPARWSCGI